MKHVILGAGPAGVIAAETLRKHAPTDEIVLIGDEAEPPYSRMAIPYLLSGQIGEAGTHLRHGTDHYAAQRITLRRGRAKQLDSARRQVLLDDGSTVGFDRLLIATGSSAATPPIPGIEGTGVHACWTLADARAILERAKPGARVLQMGAGFIGCIILEALATRGVQLTVVEMGDRMVPRMMGPTAGGMIKDWCEKKGVTVHTGARVEAIERGLDERPHAGVREVTRGRDDQDRTNHRVRGKEPENEDESGPRHLDGRFQLRDRARLEREPLFERDAPQGRHAELSYEEDEQERRGHDLEVRERDEPGDQEDLVDDRVEHGPQGRGPVFSGQITVQNVRQPQKHVNRERGQHERLRVAIDQRHGQRQEHEAEERDLVRGDAHGHDPIKGTPYARVSSIAHPPIA